MKASVMVKKEVEIKTVLIDIHVRYVGGDDGDIPEDFPLLNGSQWRAIVDIDSGTIDEWPQGEARQMHVKVCDEGKYTLFDDSGEEVATIDGYVPHGVVPGDYGDYVILDIDENGVIKNWPKRPCVDEFFQHD